jgi:hypothetical protein
MKRYTETELEKIVRIGKARIDQIIETACVRLESVKPKESPFVAPEGTISGKDLIKMINEYIGLKEMEFEMNMARIKRNNF